MKKSTQIIAAIGASIICAASSTISAFAKPEPIVAPESSIVTQQDIEDAAMVKAEQAQQDLQELASDVMKSNENAVISDEEKAELNALAQQVMNESQANVQNRESKKKNRRLTVILSIGAMVAAAAVIFFTLFGKKLFNNKDA